MNKKMAVYICTGCGIGETVDIEALSKAGSKAAKSPVQTHAQFCSPEGVELIKKDIAEQGVNTICLGACSPRVMTDVFSFPDCLVDRVNLREQVAWCQKPNDEDTQMMAEDYLRMGVTKLKKMEMPEAYKPDQEMSKDILVIGGGITGLTAALEASRAGYNAVLVEKEKELGGFQKNVRQKATFPYKDVVNNNLADLIREVKASEKIKVYTGATVEKTVGGPCLFKVAIKQNESTAEHNIGAIVLATGWQPYDPTKLPEKLSFGKSDRIITNAMFEQANKAATNMANVAFIQCAGSRDENHLPYCSTVCCLASLKQAVQIKQKNPEANVFVVYKELRTPGQAEDFYRKAQEVGVTFIRCQDPEVVVSGPGVTVKGVDELLGQEVELPPLDLVVLATGMVPATAFGEDIKKKAEPQTPPPADALPVPVDVIRASDCLNLEYRQGPELPDLKYGFPDSHFVCFPYESRRTGIYAAGCVRRPMGSAAAFEDATGAAMKAIQCVEAVFEGRAVHPRSGDLSFPEISLSRCTQCKRCTDECPFGALNEDEKGNPITQPTRCRRCGTCMGACPERLISFKNYSVDMVGSMIKEVEIPESDEEKPRVLVLVCENDAYPALDMVGLKKSQYSPFVRAIPLRCLGSLNLIWINDALSKGFDGVIIFGCRHGDDYQCHFVRGSELANIRMSKISETLTRLALEPERIRVEEVSITDWEKIPQIIGEFMETIDDIGLNPFKDL